MADVEKKVVIVIPCRNEASGIAKVLQGIPREQLTRAGFSTSVLVIDNNSTDDTADIARTHGAMVLCEERPGKGNALRLGFRSIPADTEYVVMMDGDHTYQANEVLRMIEPLDSGFCDVVIGSRLAGKISKDAMTLFNRFGNWGFSHLVRYFYNANVTDALSGFFAWKRNALERLSPHLVSEGFGIEMEMVTKMARLGEDVYCVPITYTADVGESHLHPVYDGFRILKVFIVNLFWRPRERSIRPLREQLSDATM